MKRKSSFSLLDQIKRPMPGDVGVPWGATTRDAFRFCGRLSDEVHRVDRVRWVRGFFQSSRKVSQPKLDGW